MVQLRRNLLEEEALQEEEERREEAEDREEAGLEEEVLEQLELALAGQLECCWKQSLGSCKIGMSF